MTVVASATATSKPSGESARTPAPAAPRLRNSRRVKPPVKPAPSPFARLASRATGMKSGRIMGPVAHSVKRLLGSGHLLRQDERPRARVALAVACARGVAAPWRDPAELRGGA